ncbi:glycosyltransferase family 4 protein [Tolypothrix sp. PCC 7910]|uniref:glycosyltransferase family 4 protein n=1 Tax=Tolypothrix sp. PCC 7910 TaxID=2099387 RepID=UPI0014276F46|nr:glycosyltransferase family 1 protein [Tolypothrix sp. PCC 7910]QIR37801.1 glycosyltransferase family 4 protein [Tolypothrix sp. PCC 7910]
MHILIAALHRPTKPTGVCRHAANLAKCLADTDKTSKVTLLIGSWQNEYFETSFSLESKKISLVSVDINNTAVNRNIWYLWGLPQLAKQHHADLVHLSFPLPFIRQLFPCPVVATIHDLYPYEYPENFGYPNVIFNQFFLKQCINNSDGLSCVSQYTLEKLKEYFPKVEKRKKTAVIYNYVDFSQITAQIPKSTNINLPFLLAVAQHRKNKNLDLLIKSYYLLLKNKQINDSTQLIIVGSTGPETENIHNLIQALSLQDRILLMTSIKDEELRWLYENSQLLVVPSSTEGFCLPLAEALSLACKVVCSNIPIFREIGNSNCNYFELQGDIAQNIATAITESLSEQGSYGIIPDKRFCKLTTAHQYLKFYDKI